jgi:flagellar biosynthesis protein FliR
LSLDSHLFWSFFSVFIRVGAAFLASPLFGGVVPVQIRIFLSGAIALALIPVVQPFIGEVPADLSGLVFGIAYEAAIGLLMGFCLQALFASIQMAGAFLDLQLGISGAQVFDPVAGAPSSVLSQFKFWCAIAILFSINGHHILIRALASSYAMKPLTMASMDGIQSNLLAFLSQLGLLSLQIAAPVAAVAFVVDSASALINKAVPQFQVFQVMTPAKIALGTVGVMASLPVVANAVNAGVTHTFDAVQAMFGG